MIIFQRPTAKELLRHPFIKKAKRNNQLMDLIDRYRKWRLTHANESDSDSADSDNDDNGDADSDWDIGTIRDPAMAAAVAATVDDDDPPTPVEPEHRNGSGEDRLSREPSTSPPPANSYRSGSPVKNRVDQYQRDNSPLRDNRVTSRSEFDLVR